MKVAPVVTVLVGVRIDPTRGRATRSRIDAAGVALAQQALGEGHEARLCHAGTLPESVARDYLAQGVSQLAQLPMAASASLAEVTTALAQACRDSSLVIAGPRGESGLASGLLPYALARQLQWPLISDVIDLQREADGGWRVLQALPRGARHAWRLDPGRAAVLVTSARLAQREDLPSRHAWVAAQAGRVVELAPAAAAATLLQGAPLATAPDWQCEPARRQRRPLMPVSTESGAARMARATGGAASNRQAGVVIREGSPTEKARRLLDHLQQLGLVQPPPGS